MGVPDDAFEADCPRLPQLESRPASTRERQTKINAQGRQDLRIGRLASQVHQAFALPPVASCLARFHTLNPRLQGGESFLQAPDPPIQFRVGEPDHGSQFALQPINDPLQGCCAMGTPP